MGKNIKDYLHLYLGCEMINYKCDWIGPLTTDLLDAMKDNDYYSLLKPILRKLSDMIEEEEKEVFIIEQGVGMIELFTKGDAKSWFEGEYKRCLPTTFQHLLSKHFDLFGLIEAGLAIDKTTLKV